MRTVNKDNGPKTHSIRTSPLNKISFLKSFFVTITDFHKPNSHFTQMVFPWGKGLVPLPLYAFSFRIHCLRQVSWLAMPLQVLMFLAGGGLENNQRFLFIAHHNLLIPLMHIVSGTVHFPSLPHGMMRSIRSSIVSTSG